MRVKGRVTLRLSSLILAGALGISSGVVFQTLQVSASSQGSGHSAWNEISPDRLLEGIKVLASDEYEGRAPASKGEELTTAFIEARFEKLRLKPGNPDGTYFQKVPMVGITADPGAQLVFTQTGKDNRVTLKYGDEFVAWTKRQQPEVSIDADQAKRDTMYQGNSSDE